jgi:hypothetical protein
LSDWVINFNNKVINFEKLKINFNLFYLKKTQIFYQLRKKLTMCP